MAQTIRIEVLGLIFVTVAKVAKILRLPFTPLVAVFGPSLPLYIPVIMHYICVGDINWSKHNNSKINSRR
jgi:hypothetical protein